MKINMTNSLYYKNLSTVPKIKGVFVISHGMAEHMGRYDWLISKLNSDGFHVISKDHRGHGNNIHQGNTPGLFSKKNGWIKVRDDLDDLFQYVKNKYPELPCVLLAHSMGSWIALSLLNKKLNVDSIILSGSAKIPRTLIYLQLFVIKFEIMRNGYKAKSKFIDDMTIRKFNRDFAPNRTQNDWISSDKKSVDNYTNDSLCGFIVTNSLWHDVCITMLNIFKKNYYLSSNFDIPILIITGKNDAANAKSKYARALYLFLNKIFKCVQIIILKNSRHEIFTDIEKDVAYDHCMKFVNK